ncbi:fimbrial protein [Serratia fonticola]|uniref:fimbrial protein n=1 Tax=Serratia fonticola TaxID=47917 RepID=UPI000E2E0443|nr:fimbrial protein [Serratia fonticola]RDL15127.1 type 1 fimbria pilin [Serratia fonticola]
MKNIVKRMGGLVFLYSTHAWSYAGCNTESSGVTINAPTLVVQRDVPVGARLAVPEFTSPTTLLFSCPEENTYPTGWQVLGVKATTVYSGMTANGGRIYKTNLPGLGVQLGGMTETVGPTGWIGTSDNIDGNVNQAAFSSINGVFRKATAGAAVTFYKIGDMSSGVLTQRVGSLILGNAGSWAQPEVPVNITGMSVSVLACSLTTPTVAAPLGNVYATAFTGVGSTTGNVDFNLGLNCAAGTKINVTMNGTQNSDTANTSVLALTGARSAGVAKGVGAQILYNNKPLNIGSRLLLKTAAGGIETFPFKARYYQTLSNVLPGSANATATLNITYL